MKWKPIRDFPDYSVSSSGLVRNDHTRRLMALGQNQHGVVQVGLMHEGVQYRRGVALLVAREFLAPPPMESFNTVINLDGDRLNNDYTNLLWRPRWFAIRYHKQFTKPPQGFQQPIKEINTGEVFANSMEAAMQYGLLDREILIATLNRTYVWPTYQEFRVISE